jgi:hypothetical protein
MVTGRTCRWPGGEPVPARNIYHDAVVEALVADGWTITHDPLAVQIGLRRLFVDLSADRMAIGAERAGERIAVEVQSFLSKSDVDDLYRAVGQYVVYKLLLDREPLGRVLYLGVTTEVDAGILAEPLGRLVLTELGIRLMVFDPDERRVIRWTS